MTHIRIVVRLLFMRRVGRWFCFCILILLVCPVDSFAAGKPNVVLITLDSLRADRVGTGLTPNLDSFAHHGMYFLQAYSQAPLTVASHATILTGVYPQIHRASELGVALPTALPYLPDRFHAAGYRTAAFVGSIELDPRNGPFQRYDRGFDLYDAEFHSARLGESRSQSVERHGEEVVVRATKWLAANKQRPFFLWVNLHDASASDSTSYNRPVRAADAAVGKLIAFLRAQSIYDDSIILVTSAHGESLGAHGEETHGIFLYDETVHVPLMLKPAGAQLAGKQVRSRVRLIDVAPTVLEAAGIPVPPQMQGQSLLRIAQAAAQSDQPAYSRSDLPLSFGCAAMESWLAGKYLYIRAPKPELYDLIADPRAEHNLASTAKATLDTLAAQLRAFDSRLGNEAGKESDTTLTSREMQKLASLGYVGLQRSSSSVGAATQGTDPKDEISTVNKTLAALAAVDDGKPEKAIAILKALAPQPPYLAELVMGLALLQQQQYAAAIPFLHRAIELQPDSPWAHYAMGLALMKTGDFKTAAVHLEISSKRLPSFAASTSALAEANARLGAHQDAASGAASHGEHKNRD